MDSTRPPKSCTSSGIGAGHGRRLSPTLLGYIAREFLVPLCCCTIAFLTLFLVRDVFDVLGDFIKAEGASAGSIAMYFVYRQAANIPNVLPMSILLSCSFESKPFVTTSNRQELQELSQGTVAIVSFSTGGELLTLNGSPGMQYEDERGTALIRALAARQFKAIRDAIDREYDVVGPSTYAEASHSLEPGQKPAIAAAIKAADADFGLLVKSHYGWDWQPSKTGVDLYRTLTSFAIANQQGDIVWGANTD